MIERRFTGSKPSTAMPRGAVDAQLHLYKPGFPAAPGAPALPENAPGLPEYSQVMDWLGIERFVVTQGNAHGFDNENIKAVLRDAGPKARGVGIITAHTTDAEMASLSDAGIVGARIMDLPGGAAGLGSLEDVDARAHAHGWMMAVQFDGSDIAAHFERLRALRSNWVLDHHGKFFRGAAPDGPEIALVRRLIDGGNCWFKLAGCYESSRLGGPDFEDVAANARVVAAHAPERIIWGTNFPHNQATSTANYPDDAALLDTVLGWIPDEKGRHLALVENPEELFGFPSMSQT